MKEWQQRKRGLPTYDTGGSSTGNETSVTLPLSQGEWDEPLGLPLCVVCHGVRSFIYTVGILLGVCDKTNIAWKQADKVDALEVEHGWKEEEFDFVLQFLRTILMKRKHPSRDAVNPIDSCRWCIPDIHLIILPQFPPNAHPLHTRHTFSAQKANSQTQRHGQGQSPCPTELGFMG